MKISKISIEEWDNLLDRERFTSPFYTSEWLRIISDYYNIKLQLIYIEQGPEGWIAPVFEHLPWSHQDTLLLHSIGYGSPLPTHNAKYSISHNITKVMAEVGKNYKYNKISAVLFPRDNWDIGAGNDSTVCVGLTGDKDKTFSEVLTGNARTAIRKSKKYGVNIYELPINGRKDALRSVINLLHSTQKYVGSNYLTDLKFIENISKLDSNNFSSRLFIGEVNSTQVAMAVTIASNKEVFHLFHGWDRTYADYAVNQSLIWSMIEYAEDRKSKIFNMGSSHTKSLLEAKLRYGGKVLYTPKVLIDC